jgi:hypothetical protein
MKLSISVFFSLSRISQRVPSSSSDFSKKGMKPCGQEAIVLTLIALANQ